MEYLTENTWVYQGKPITHISDMPENCYGFIYETTHLPTLQKYIGKKVLYFIRNKKLGKKEIELLKEERSKLKLKGKTPIKKEVITESDWKTYYGSQKEILDLVKKGNQEDFKREILQFVFDKKQLTYYECKYLFNKEVLENRNNYINNNILGKFFKKDFLT
jgi:hypothetical protein